MYILTIKVSFREAGMINNVISFFSLVIDSIVTVFLNCCSYYQIKINTHDLICQIYLKEYLKLNK